MKLIQLNEQSRQTTFHGSNLMNLSHIIHSDEMYASRWWSDPSNNRAKSLVHASFSREYKVALGFISYNDYPYDQYQTELQDDNGLPREGIDQYSPTEGYTGDDDVSWMFDNHWGGVIEMDSDRVRHNHKMVPYSDPDGDIFKHEKEEAIIVKDGQRIKDLDRFIVAIYVDMNTIKRTLQQKDFIRWCKNSYGVDMRVTLPKLVRHPKIRPLQYGPILRATS